MGASGASGAEIRTSDPASDARGLVVRVAGIVQTTGGGGGGGDIPITTATRTQVPANLASVPLLPANAARRGGYIYNNTLTGSLFLAFGTVAAAAGNFTAELGPGDGFPIPDNATFPVFGIWDVADGFAQVTEETGGAVVNPITVATRTQVPQNAADVLILAANPARRAGFVFNDTTSTDVLYLAFGSAAASTASFTAALNPGEGFPIPDNATFEIRGIWGSAGGGQALVTEMV